MKKIICLMLAFLMIVLIASCGNPNVSEPDTDELTTEESAAEEITTEEPTTEEPTTEEPTTEEPEVEEPEEEPEEELAPLAFKTGYARADITPDENKIGNYGYAQIADHIYTTCLAVFDGESIALFISIDTGSLMETACDAIRYQITNSTGVIADNIFISATHTHSSITYTSYSHWGAQTVAKNTAKAAKAAIDDLSDTEMFIGRGETTGMAFVRRYVDKYGNYAAISPTSPDGEWLDRESTRCVADADDTLQVVRFVREDKKDIVLANWQGHLASAIETMGMTDALSSDIAHYLREDIEAGDAPAKNITWASSSPASISSLR